MAAVNDADLRRSVTEQFYEKTLLPDIGTLLGSFPEDETPSDVARNLGDYVETRAWLWFGRQLGYFDELPLDAGEAGTVRRVREAHVLNDLRWPGWFTEFAKNMIEGYTPLEEQLLPPGDPATLAIFQSVLIAAEGFREPLLLNLLENLHSRESVLDDFSQPTGAEVLDIIRLGDLFPRSTPVSCVAGFIPLLELLETFESIFPPYAEQVFADLPADGPLARRVLARVTGQVLRWRLNLWDERTARRLRAVTAMFFRIAEQEFASLPTEQGISWSAEVSKSYLDSMLARWRDRGGLEPDNSLRDLDLVGRGGGAAAATS